MATANQRHDAAIELGTIHAGYRRRRLATRRLDALTLQWMRHERATLELVRLMSHDADNDGRGQTDPMPGSVNGTEVRWSERWLQPTDPTEDYDTCISIAPDGTRTVFNPPMPSEDSSGRKPLTEAELTAMERDIRLALQRTMSGGTQADYD